MLPELPARGPGADLVGRTCALLPDLPVDLQPSGWRLTSRPGIDARRASSYLNHDLDAFSEALDGRTAPVKVAVCGPWTLAASLQLPRGEPVLSDPGALRDLGQAMVEALAGHVADVRRRLPGCSVVLQLDEPMLPLVLAGHVSSFSGAGSVRAVPVSDVVTSLGSLVRAVAERDSTVVAHCCAADPPVDVFRESGVAGVSLDLPLVGQTCDDALGDGDRVGRRAAGRRRSGGRRCRCRTPRLRSLLFVSCGTGWASTLSGWRRRSSSRQRAAWRGRAPTTCLRVLRLVRTAAGSSSDRED